MAGFTQRVVELKNVLSDINEGKYERTMVSGEAATGQRSDIKANSGKAKG